MLIYRPHSLLRPNIRFSVWKQMKTNMEGLAKEAPTMLDFITWGFPDDVRLDPGPMCLTKALTGVNGTCRNYWPRTLLLLFAKLHPVM